MLKYPDWDPRYVQFIYHRLQSILWMMSWYEGVLCVPLNLFIFFTLPTRINFFKLFFRITSFILCVRMTWFQNDDKTRQRSNSVLLFLERILKFFTLHSLAPYNYSMHISAFDSTSSLNSTIGYDILRRNGSNDLDDGTIDKVRYACRHLQLSQSLFRTVDGMQIESRQTFRQ